MGMDYYLFVGVSVLLAFILPLALGVALAVGRITRLRTILIGAAVFTVFQLLTRMPLIYILESAFPGLVPMSGGSPHYYLYILVLSLTAGLFEELGRFAGFVLFLKKDRGWWDGIGFGIGHGGVEALVLVGISAVSSLFTYGLLPGQPAWIAALGGVERVSAMILHLGFTLLVLHGIRCKRLSYVFLAVAAHTVVNFLALSFSGFAGMVGTELMLLVIALGMLAWVFWSRKLYKKTEVEKSQKAIEEGFHV